MQIHIVTFKDEIERAYRTLGFEKGFDQNIRDIRSWRNEGLIDHGEAKELRLYNKKRYQDLFIDWCAGKA